MTTYDVNSTIVGNAVASPKTMSATSIAKGEIRSSVAAFAASTAMAATAGQTIGLFRIPAKARIVSLIPAIVSTATTGSWKVGLSRTAENGGTIIDDDILATAIDMSLALLTDLTSTVGGRGISAVTLQDREKSLAVLAATSFASTGAANDAEVDIYATVVTVAGTTTLACAWFLQYVID